MSEPIDVSPVTGLMDVRSSPDAIPFGSYRHVLNCHAVLTDKLARMTGWEKHLSREDYNNQDLHDQLLSLAGHVNREPITFLFQGISTKKTTKLYAGTARRLYALNNSTGNWKIIADLYGSDGTRWSADQVNDVIVFTNDADALVYHIFDQPPTEANDQSVRTIPDLDTFNITRAGVVVAWKDLMILCNVVQDGQFFSNRVIWSDFRRPTSFAPSSASVAGNFDLTSGESILAARPLGNVLLLYTNFGIWEVNAVGGAEVLSFNKRYEPHRNTTRCLAYRRTLISTGSAHLYMGHDGIYSYDLYHIEPTLVAYIHKGSGLIYSTLDRNQCDVHCAGFNPTTKEAIFSWAKTGQSQPSSSLLVNTDQSFTAELDHGFSAFANYAVDEGVLSLQDYILDQCICGTRAELVKEGGFCVTPAAVVCPTEKQPQSFYTSQTKTIDLGGGDTIEVEDYDKSEPDDDSFCAIYPTLTLNDLCASAFKADECKAGQLFVAASATDYCLKQFTEVFFRERATGFGVCGTYALDGYRSRLRSGAMNLNETKHWKQVNRFEVEALAEPQTVPSLLTLRFGTAAQAFDPNSASGRCAIIWEDEEPKQLDCLSDQTAAQHIADNTTPNESLEWPLYRTGRYLYIEMEISNPASSDRGGAVTFSRYSMDISKLTRSYP